MSHTYNNARTITKTARAICAIEVKVNGDVTSESSFSKYLKNTTDYKYIEFRGMTLSHTMYDKEYDPEGEDCTFITFTGETQVAYEESENEEASMSDQGHVNAAIETAEFELSSLDSVSFEYNYYN